MVAFDVRRYRYHVLGIGGAIASLLISQTPTSAIPVRVNRWLQVRQVTGNVTYLERRQSQPARVGQRLTAIGDGLRTTSNSTAQLEVDTGIGFIDVFERTELRIRALSVAPDNGRITHLTLEQGQIRVRTRSFTHEGSELEIETPAGVSGVRGTEFGLGVQPTGQTGTATQAGAVATTAQDQTVMVPGGFQNLMVPGSPPTAPVPLRNDTSLVVRRNFLIEGNVRYVQLVGQVDPVNIVLVDGEQQTVSAVGEFRLTRPAATRTALQIQVITPLGRQQIHEVRLLAPDT
ncbi:hypothetical protein XM38_023230 [Halomicronema hongdechloris C2206]|uniref:FecR protein domain-containing protein n=1 Tax=Halomicronema hongdechloris C2206 TaxID=1641165 RepID=A0A1Z3HM41_9CYAN|nr:FecR domain-containing protein [Halomicronema hongdechloris]ASC71371.1 hypothetical protein XM38_023230 [Halomicronema hongdechloris C2206]